MKSMSEMKERARRSAESETSGHRSTLAESVPLLVSLEIKLPTFNVSLDDFLGRVRPRDRDSGPGLELARIRNVDGGGAVVMSEDKSGGAGTTPVGGDETCTDDAETLAPSIVFVPGVNGRLRRKLRERGARGKPGTNEIVVVLDSDVDASSPSRPVVETDQREAAAGGGMSDAVGMYGGHSGAGAGRGIAEDITLNSIVAGEFGAENDLLKPGCMRTVFERGLGLEVCVSLLWVIAD